MKKILLVVHPKWCKMIFSGKKTIEVRRTRPKLEPPFEVLVYCTKAKNIREDGLYLLPNDKELYLGCKEKDLGFVCWEGDFRNGKVIGEFVCDEIYVRPANVIYYGKGQEDYLDLLKSACMTEREVLDYMGGQFNRDTYFWHISDLKIYDKPRELNEFKNLKGEPIKNAYQSWGYINEQTNRRI